MKTQITHHIQSFVKTYHQTNDTVTTWQEPLVTFASAHDPLFEELKSAVSPTHAVPTDFLNDAKTVIAFFIPFAKAVVKSNIEGREASKEWAVAYMETNKLIYDINVFINKILGGAGYESTVLPATHNFDEEKLISDWSHRHVAYIAGLGDFGLNNMLITEKGCCGRFGSIITNLKIFPTERQNKVYCLYTFMV